MKQAQVTTFTIMEYIKSHNLSLEDLSSLSDELALYKNTMIANSLQEETKFNIVRDCIWYYFDKPDTILFNKEFNEFLSKVTTT